jgi:hypothetical protein
MQANVLIRILMRRARRTTSAVTVGAKAHSDPIWTRELVIAGYGMKIMPLGVIGPVRATLPTAPVFRLIVPRELAG